MNGCVLALIIVGVIHVVIVGGVIGLAAYGAKLASNNGIPTSSQVVTSAQSNITAAQTANSVDTTTALPTNATTSFSTSDTIYLTYTLGGNAGYVMEKTYDSTGTIVIQSKTPHAVASGDTNGYIFFSGLSSGSYVSALYWCQKSDCSDAALAQVLSYTVS